MSGNDPVAAREGVRWSFPVALAALLGLMLWAEAALALARATRTADGPLRLMHSAGLFLALLPFFALLVYRGRVVFGFFRSITIGVTNLVLIGLGAIIGVLFQQEDPFQPTPPGAVQSLREHGGGEAGAGTWSREERLAYQDYQSFRTAQAFFAYHLLDNLHLRGAMGFGDPQPGEALEDRAAMSNLAGRLPELRSRFGEEYAVAVESQSETGLRTRARNAEIRVLEEQWDDLWWTLFVWADRLDLRRAYRSDWYAVLWAVLFCGVLSNTFRGGWRRLLRPRMWGFAITHAGVLAVIAGGYWGRVAEQRGMLELHVGEQSGRFMLYEGRQVDLSDRSFLGDGTPFRVRLDAFRADHHDVLDVVFLETGADGSDYAEFELAQQPKIRVFEGKTAAYDRTGDGEPRLRLEVLEHARQADTRLRLRAADDGEPGFPVARFRLLGADGSALDEGYLIESPMPGREMAWPHGPSGTRVRFVTVHDAAAARAHLAVPVPERFGQILLPPHDAAGSAQILTAAPGAARDFAAPGGPYCVELLAATPDFRLQAGAGGELAAAPLEQPLERTAPRNPAVQLRIVAPDGREENRWILEQEFHREGLTFPDLAFQFRWDAWAAPALRRVEFFALPDGGLMAGEVGAPDTLREMPARGFTLDFDGGERMVVEEAFARGTGDLDFTPLAGGDFYDTAPPAIRLSVTTPGSQHEFVMDAGDVRPEFVEYSAPDSAPRRVALLFREDRDQGELPIEWRSRLTILVPDGAGWRAEATGDIRVNDYFTYGGYRFFQTNHDPADPTYSGIGVVYDPGIEPVVFGLFSVMFGTIGVFLIKPLFTRQHRGTE